MKVEHRPYQRTCCLQSRPAKQLLQLPGPEFITRCLKTPLVSKDQAVAFQAKYWKLHIDSQHHSSASNSRPQGGEGAEEQKNAGFAIRDEWKYSSREPRAEVQALRFKERLRPGMVVAWSPGEDTNANVSVVPSSRNLVMLLSDETCSSSDADSRVAAEPDANVKCSRAYRCAFVSPGVMPGAFELHPWLQCVVGESQMDAEVILEYDSATRYYYETL